MLYNFDELSFQILTVDRFYHKKGFFEINARPYAALSYRVSGGGDFKMGGKSFMIEPGDILFIPANMSYEVEYSVSESIVANLNGCNYFEPEAFKFKNATEGELIFLELLRDWKERGSVNRTKANIYNILERLDSEQKVMGEKTAFAAAIQYIEAHFCEETLDVGEVCETCFVSPSSLQRAFLQHFGISPKQYIIKLRMNRALKLLTESSYSVKEIAALCGFADEKYFSRAFKIKYGYPPSKLRNYIAL